MVAMKEYETERTTYFYCYSAKVRRFLRENGIRWIDKGVNKSSNRPYWIFEQTDDLGKLLEKYKTEK